MKNLITFLIVFSFITIGINFASPTLTSPSNHSTDVSCETNFLWYDGAATSSWTWELLISTSSSFGNSTSYTGSYSGITGMYTLGYNVNVFGNTKYYWKVRSKSSSGIWGSYSSVWDFTTAPRPSTSALMQPGNNATNVNIPVFFSMDVCSRCNSLSFIYIGQFPEL